MLYFIKREGRPVHHKAPYHQFIICTKKPVAEWEAGWTGNRSWVWKHDNGNPEHGWLLVRWEGLDIDYGHIVRTSILPDGTCAGIFHRHRDLGIDRSGEKPVFLGYDTELQAPWSLLPGAVWWSSQQMPEWIEKSGVVYPPDSFTRNDIIEQEEEYAPTRSSGADIEIRFTVRGMNRSSDWPEWWTGKGDEWEAMRRPQTPEAAPREHAEPEPQTPKP